MGVIRVGGHRLPLVISDTTIGATGAANPHRRQHQRPGPGGQAGKPASTAPRSNTSEAHNPTAVYTTRGKPDWLFRTGRTDDPGITNNPLVGCRLPGLGPGCAP